MKVGIVSESPADDAVIRILLAAISGRQIEQVSSLRLRAGGWPSMRDALSREFLQLHYRSDAHAVAAVADSDDTPVHEDSHDVDAEHALKCRICELQRVIRSATRDLRPRSHAPPLNCALGLAVPALEAWLLCGIDNHSVEANYERLHNEGRSLFAMRRELKKKLYGTDQPTLHREMEVATREAKRLAADLGRLETHFPRGFGLFARQVRAW